MTRRIFPTFGLRFSIALRAAAAAFALALAGCASVQPVRLDLCGSAGDANTDALAAVLSECTNKAGYIDCGELKRRKPLLDACLKRLAVTGPAAAPSLYPTPDARLAYWYNARAAWAMRLALDANCPRKALAPARLEERPFPLDGRQMTLDAIDAIILRDYGWQAAVAAPCVRLRRARLPARPFAARDVRPAVERRLQEYLADRDRFVIDVAGRDILFPPVLWGVRERLVAEHEQAFHTRGSTLNTALLPFASGVGSLRLQDATGYAEKSDSRDGPLACLRQ
jgi:hypothetical protein